MLEIGEAFARVGARRRPEDGAAAVEFALVLPVLIMLLLGVTTAGLSYSNAIGVTNAVREGARFGATADAASTTWTSDVIARVRATQFDDPGEKTAVCVQLVKGATQVALECDGANGPALAMPDMASYPKVPAGLPGTACVVRVVAARDFEIDVIVAPSWESTIIRGSVARYERDTC